MSGTETLHSWAPDYAVAPGMTLQETLEELGMTQRDLASRSGLSPKTINRIVKGEDPISPETANKLELVTGVPASLWNNLEKRYRERVAKVEQRERLVEFYQWVRDMKFPLPELRKRGYLPEGRAHGVVVEGVLRFLGVASPEAWEKAYAASVTAFRRSPKLEHKVGITASWLRIAELEAAKAECQPYSAPKFRAALDTIRTLTREAPADYTQRIREECAAAGVAVVFVREFPGGGINGATRWLTPERAMIALSIRGRYADILWFTFFHEAGHVLKHGKKKVFIEADNGTRRDHEEEEADRFATDYLIPPAEQAALSGLQSRTRIKAFASRLGIHPGIVVGQLCHRGVIPYSHCQDLRVPLEWVEE